MNKDFDFVTVVFCIAVICLLIPATRKPIIKFIKPLFESEASNEDYKRKLLDEYTKETTNNSWNERGITGNEKDPITDPSKSLSDVFTDLSFDEYDKIYNKNNDLSQRLLNNLSYTDRNSVALPNFYASMRSTQGYAESIAASQPYYLDYYGNVVNEKPNKFWHRYKLIIYKDNWAYQRH